MPTVYNIDHSPLVVDHNHRAVHPGEGIEVDAATAKALVVSGGPWSKDAKAAKEAARLFAEKIEAEARAALRAVEGEVAASVGDTAAPAPDDEPEKESTES